MNWETKYKILEENVFADMVVMVGRYMEYKARNSVWDRQEFIEYYRKRNSSIVGRCIVQANVIRQAKRYYEESGEHKDITYSKVKSVFRRNTKILFYRLSYEQYYFWKFVMDYIVENDDGLLDIIIKEVMKECEYYSHDEDIAVPNVDCLQRILNWYYISLKMKKGIWNKSISMELLTMFKRYKNFSKFKRNCRIYMRSI